MKKYSIPIVLAAVFGAYVLFTSKDSSTNIAPPPSGDTTGNTQPPDTGSTQPPATSAGAYKDGTYTGPVSDAFYGKIQVVATIKGGSITAISVPVYPNDNGETLRVNNRAIPTLKQEVITAQSANIDAVSGATQTSDGFKQSLAAALSKATN